MTEHLIQIRLFWWLQRKGQRWIVPNFNGFYTGEMDVCSVMKSGMVNEFEIKVTRADFKADSKKQKHEILSDVTQTGLLVRQIPRWDGGFNELNITAPNFFYYVVPRDLITPEEIPAYAGLIYINPENSHDIRTIKKAKRIHANPITDEKRYKIADSLMWRFWNMKRKNNEPFQKPSNQSR